MVLAILENRKSQTRRIVKPQAAVLTSALARSMGNPPPPAGLINKAVIPCPYGKPGDRLWVREEHYAFGHWEPVTGVKTKGGRQKWKFVADDGFVRFPDEADAPKEFRKGQHHRDPATPAWHKRLARFMPRVFSRIALEIVAVRVERLQEISEEDALAEGCDDFTLNEDVKMWSSVVEKYAELWDSINDKNPPRGEIRQGIHPHSWDANPWVWVIEFKKIEKDLAK